MGEALSNVSLILLIAAGICLALAVFFWFYFRIPHVIGYLINKSNRESVERLRGRNVHTDKNTRTTEIKPVVKSVKSPAESQESPGTDILEENRADELESEATGLLETEQRDFCDCEATGLLEHEPEEEAVKVASVYTGMHLRMLDEVMIIHTDEVIE